MNEKKVYSFFIVIVIIIFFIVIYGENKNEKTNSAPIEKEKIAVSKYEVAYKEPTKASESNIDIDDPFSGRTSVNLTKADISWHALNTFGWNCEEVVKMGKAIKTNGKELRDAWLIKQITGEYYIITCSSGLKLRMYPRNNTFPTITNIYGGYENLD